MQIAITAAKFTPDEADGLRRAMATFRHNGNVHLFRDKFIDGMTRRGYDREVRRTLLQPDRRLRRIRLSREPRGEFRAARLCLRLDQVPLSRMSSAPPSSTASRWVSTSRPSWCATRASTASRCGRWTSISAHGTARWSAVSDDAQHRFAVRLGFRQIQGLNEDELNKLIAARGNGYASIERLAAVAGVSRFTIERLAEADAFRSCELDRRAALWAARRLDTIGIERRSGKRRRSRRSRCLPRT